MAKKFVGGVQKSLLNRRKMMLEDKENYIQNGLVCWIDGYDRPIDNVVKDRTGNTCMMFENGYLYDNILHYYEPTIGGLIIDLPQSFIESSSNDDSTVEIVLSVTKVNSGYNRYIDFNRFGTSSAPQLFNFWIIPGDHSGLKILDVSGCGSSIEEVKLGKTMTYSAIANTCIFKNGLIQNGIKNRKEFDGTQCKIASLNDYEVYRNNRINIFCVRLYDRKLSEEEIAHNVNIDKKRFYF